MNQATRLFLNINNISFDKVEQSKPESELVISISTLLNEEPKTIADKLMEIENALTQLKGTEMEKYPGFSTDFYRNAESEITISGEELHNFQVQSAMNHWLTLDELDKGDRYDGDFSNLVSFLWRNEENFSLLE